jgi:hypothetical protein
MDEKQATSNTTQYRGHLGLCLQPVWAPEKISIVVEERGASTFYNS